jgi:hypothetical protein
VHVAARVLVVEKGREGGLPLKPALCVRRLSDGEAKLHVHNYSKVNKKKRKLYCVTAAQESEGVDLN